jgi:microcompartment protein CcmL/EutN
MEAASTDAAIGMLEVEGVAGIIVGADAALKSATLRLLGWDSIGGYTTVFFSGSISDVQAGLQAGEQAARDTVEHVVGATLTRPHEVCRRYVTQPTPPHTDTPGRALGLLEARGYGIQVGACDSMSKAADVDILHVITVHNRVVCTLLQGDVGSVREALAVGRQKMAASQHFMSATVIPQPQPQVVAAFVMPATAAGA